MLEYDPSVVTYDELLDVFWKSHDPTQVTTTVGACCCSDSSWFVLRLLT